VEKLKKGEKEGEQAKHWGEKACDWFHALSWAGGRLKRDFAAEAPVGEG
jgi:hypothetical protein